jgi:Fe-S oxidoreductase
MFINTETLLRPAMWFTPLANTLAEFPPARWLLELIVGIDHRRPLPPLKKWAVRRRFEPSERSTRAKVVLYPDLFARYFEPELTQAAVDVLEHHDIEVYLPDVPWANMPALTHGAVEIGRQHIAKVARVLAPFAYKGIPIVALDPSACLCLKQDFLYYLDTPETRAVSRHTVEIGEFLLGLKKQNKLRTEFQKFETVLGYHQPCHHKSLKIGLPALELLQPIPGVTIHVLEEGCCGSAGPWGMLKKNYDESMAIGEDLFHVLNCSRRKIVYGLTECPTCKAQMEYGGGKRTLHPIQVLALAYGYKLVEPREEGVEKLDDHGDETHQEPAHAPAEVVPPAPSMVNDEHAHDHSHTCTH